MKKNYALIGAAGYIAPRHMKAIRDTGGTLATAYDLNDSIGIIDSYFPNAAFFTEFEQFDANFHSRQSQEQKIHYVSVCSPNYLHQAHLSFALRAGADAICEKPLVISPAQLDDLSTLEKQTGRTINSILQLRLHPSILSVKQRVEAGPPDKVYDVDMSYFTSRGLWYQASWKGDERKSGGIATNIGVHFFDMLSFIFGPLQTSAVHLREADIAAGYLEFRQARVRWVLSTNRAYLPERTPEGQSTFRSITVDGDEIEFSGGFTDLHTASYEAILAGRGFGIDTVRPSIELVSDFRSAPIEQTKGAVHPDVTRILGA